MQQVGELYNKLMEFLVANGAVEVPTTEASAEEAEGELDD
jgi:hypothetical protein